MKKGLSILFAIYLLAGSAWGEAQQQFAVDYSDRYHAYPPECKPAKKNLDNEDPKNLIYFKDEKEAQEKGFVPCKLCHHVGSSGNFAKKDPSDSDIASLA